MKLRAVYRSGILSVAFTAILFGFQQQDPWQTKELLSPADAAAKLSGTKNEGHLLLHVGFEAVYKGGHIAASTYVGPGNSPEGLAKLENAVKGVAKNRAIIMYCGCCPMEKCPNIRPAYRKLKELGYSNVQVISIPSNLHKDWAEPGYPFAKGS